ncbi:hypothetical protein [Agrobacterium tumefaciens]|uniref:hypothetical protein n=1 Tax=Agrobacterium tumefaciens TaxID=358 RepID=UPI0021CE4947|nr:hypothetical protein [Agrobacterium tumefaciens]UXS66705.1 hypothetical protein FY147_27680 [Agrobacterium tumefaciens]
METSSFPDRMPDGIVLVGHSLLEEIQRPALLAALRSGKIASAGFDGFTRTAGPRGRASQPSGMLCTPHVGAQTSEAMRTLAAEVVRRIEIHATALLSVIKQQNSVVSG